MIVAAPSVAGFVLRTLLWLPPCFAAWYFCAQAHTAVVAGFARLFISFFNGLLVSATERQHGDLVFVTTLTVPVSPGQLGAVAVEVNALMYTYGLALFVALMLAARSHWRLLLCGAAILLPFQGAGVAFDFLAHVGVKLGPDIAAQARLSGARELIALAYQLGNLVLPSVLPVVLFVAFSRSFIDGLAAPGTPAHRSTGPRGSTDMTRPPGHCDPGS